jgi:hypothetical protein
MSLYRKLYATLRAMAQSLGPSAARWRAPCPPLATVAEARTASDASARDARYDATKSGACAERSCSRPTYKIPQRMLSAETLNESLVPAPGGRNRRGPARLEKQPTSPTWLPFDRAGKSALFWQAYRCSDSSRQRTFATYTI